MHVKDPVVHVSLMDYGNKKITSMHLYPLRQNVADQVAEELKTVKYATPAMEERSKNPTYLEKMCVSQALRKHLEVKLNFVI